MAQNLIPLPYGQREIPQVTCEISHKVGKNDFVEVFHHGVNIVTSCLHRSKTFTEVALKNSATVIVFGIVPETGRFGAVLQWDIKKIGPCITAASGYANRGDKGNLAATAARILDVEFGMQPDAMDLAVPLAPLGAPVRAYPNTIFAVQQGFMVGVRRWPLVLDGKGLWLEDLFPRAMSDREPWRNRVGSHAPVVSALESAQLWLIQNGYADAWGNPTAAW